MSLKKQFLKSRPVCKVTFCLDENEVSGASKIALSGSFNGWSTHDDLLKKNKRGQFSITKELPLNMEYQFRYCINENKWQNEKEADNYVNNNISNEENSVVAT